MKEQDCSCQPSAFFQEIVGDVAQALILQHVECAHPFDVYGVERTQWDVYDPFSHALRKFLPSRRGPFTSDIDNSRLFRIDNSSHQQSLVPRRNKVECRIDPNVEHTHGRIRHHESAVLHSTDTGSNNLRAGQGGIKRHVRLLRVLPEPRHLERIVNELLVIIEDHDNRAEFQAALVLGLDVDTVLIEPSERLPDVGTARRNPPQRVEHLSEPTGASGWHAS